MNTLRTVSIAIVAWVAAMSVLGDEGATSLWKLKFAENADLPPVFRQFEVRRPDGSHQIAFLASFDGGLAKRKPLMIYFDGSGAGSHFTCVGERIAMTTAGLLASMAHEHFHVAMSEKRGVEFHREGARRR